MNQINYKKLLFSYSILVLFPALFALSAYYFILTIDRKNEIETIKNNLTERVTNFMVKITQISYYTPYFKELANQIFPIIENKKQDKIYEINKKIEDLSKKLEINIRCAVYDKEMNIINSDYLRDYENRFFTYIWKDIHGINDVDYKEKKEDQHKITGIEFITTLLENKDEYCIPTFNLSTTGLLYFKNANKKTNGILLFAEVSKTGFDIINDIIKDISTYEMPIILYDTEQKKIITKASGHREIPFEKTNSEEYLDGFIENNTVWKGFNSDNYKLMFGQVINTPTKYRNKFLIVSIIVFLINIFLPAIFLNNYIKEQSLYISIRYKLIFIFALAVYMPTISL